MCLKVYTGVVFNKVLDNVSDLKRKIKPYVVYYFIWLIMNVVIGLVPILSDLLDGKTVSQIYPSLLLIYVVMLASSTHMFFKKKEDSDVKATLYFSISLVWIILLILLSTKYPYKNVTFNFILSGDYAIIFMLFISVISIVIAAIIYFPYIELDVKSNIEKNKITRSESSVRNQALDNFDNGDL